MWSLVHFTGALVAFLLPHAHEDVARFAFDDSASSTSGCSSGGCCKLLEALLWDRLFIGGMSVVLVVRSFGSVCFFFSSFFTFHFRILKWVPLSYFTAVTFIAIAFKSTEFFQCCWWTLTSWGCVVIITWHCSGCQEKILFLTAFSWFWIFQFSQSFFHIQCIKYFIETSETWQKSYAP